MLKAYVGRSTRRVPVSRARQLTARPPDVELSECGQRGAALGHTGPQGRYEGELRRVAGDAVRAQAGQHASRADFQEGGDTVFQARGRRRGTARAAVRGPPSNAARRVRPGRPYGRSDWTAPAAPAGGTVPAATFSNAASMASMCGEWNACETFSRLTRRPSEANRSATRGRLPRPRSTTDRGPLTAASPTPPVSSSGTSSSVACTGHGPVARQLLHQPTAGGHQFGRVRQRPDTGDIGGGQLADGCPPTWSAGHPRTPAAGRAPPPERTGRAGRTWCGPAGRGRPRRTRGPATGGRYVRPVRHKPRRKRRRTPGAVRAGHGPWPGR